MDALTIVILLVVAALVVWAIVLFNRVVALRARAEASWSDIEVQLKKRWDLLPRLVETVRGYAAHEASTLEDVTSARAASMAAGRPSEIAAAETSVQRGTLHLFAIAEAYPDLKADDLYQSLHTQLIEIEEAIQAARRYYNAVVRDFNTLIRQFPAVILASALSLRERDYFELDDPAHGEAPRVRGEGER